MCAQVHGEEEGERKTARKRSHARAVRLKIFTACAQIECVLQWDPADERPYWCNAPPTHTHAPHHLLNCLFSIRLAWPLPPCSIASINKPPEKKKNQTSRSAAAFSDWSKRSMLIHRVTSYLLCFVFGFIRVRRVNTEGDLWN